jgi:hypothetical protein
MASVRETKGKWWQKCEWQFAMFLFCVDKRGIILRFFTAA